MAAPTSCFKHGWLENPLLIEVAIGKSQINGPFSIAMFDYRKVFNGIIVFNHSFELEGIGYLTRLGILQPGGERAK